MKRSACEEASIDAETQALTSLSEPSKKQQRDSSTDARTSLSLSDADLMKEIKVIIRAEIAKAWKQEVADKIEKVEEKLEELEEEAQERHREVLLELEDLNKENVNIFNEIVQKMDDLHEKAAKTMEGEHKAAMLLQEVVAAKMKERHEEVVKRMKAWHEEVMVAEEQIEEQIAKNMADFHEKVDKELEVPHTKQATSWPPSARSAAYVFMCAALACDIWVVARKFIA
ncbi:hypothetical protein GOP47_0030397 [Adiantum capillus-veneris]|nr:hypothetical protein GOP47_0030397 [Adiantum capillus-veneris]